MHPETLFYSSFRPMLSILNPNPKPSTTLDILRPYLCCKPQAPLEDDERRDLEVGTLLSSGFFSMRLRVSGFWFPVWAVAP